jgi:hypothetical protein
MGHATAKPAQTAPPPPAPQNAVPLPQSTVPYTPSVGGENGRHVKSRRRKV